MTGELASLHVTVAGGGTSAGTERSGASGREAAASWAGAEVALIESEQLIGHLRAELVDVVFPAVHGPISEDSRIQGLIDVAAGPG